MKKSRISLDLSDEQKSQLEQYRARNGLRSLNAAVIHLIEKAPK